MLASRKITRVARQGGCDTGEAVITTGGKLPARHVIHTVGPVWNASEKAEAGERKEDQLLRNAYTNSLRIAVESGVDLVPRKRIYIPSGEGFMSTPAMWMT